MRQKEKIRNAPNLFGLLFVATRALNPSRVSGFITPCVTPSVRRGSPPTLHRRCSFARYQSPPTRFSHGTNCTEEWLQDVLFMNVLDGEEASQDGSSDQQEAGDVEADTSAGMESLQEILPIRRKPLEAVLSLDERPNGEDPRPRHRRPLARLIYNFCQRYAMSNPFPDLRNVTRKRESDFKFVVALRLEDGFLALLAYLTTGVMAYHFIFEKWSIVDAIYFTCACFSTVGYGDLQPTTVASKCFTCLFGLTGITLLGAAVATIGSRLVQAEIQAAALAQRESRKRLLYLYDSMPKLVKRMRLSSRKERNKVVKEAREAIRKLKVPIPGRMANFLKIFGYVLKSLTIVTIGGIIVGRFEGWSLLDSVYFALITSSTIGLGDLAPCTRNGRLAAVLMIPMGVAAAGEILASVGMALVDRRQRKIFTDQLHHGLTEEYLNAMDTNNNGMVEREEFVLFMLLEMGLVHKNEVEELLAQFDRLDATRSGFIDKADLDLVAQLRDNSLKPEADIPKIQLEM